MAVYTVTVWQSESECVQSPSLLLRLVHDSIGELKKMNRDFSRENCDSPRSFVVPKGGEKRAKTGGWAQCPGKPRVFGVFEQTTLFVSSRFCSRFSTADRTDVHGRSYGLNRHGIAKAARSDVTKSKNYEIRNQRAVKINSQ